MNSPSLTIPTTFQEGHAKACAIDRDLADAYVAHSTIGDPYADAAIEALADFGQERRSQLLEAMMMCREDRLRDAPQEMRDFVSLVAAPEEHGFHLDQDLADAGSRLFYVNMDMFIVSLVLIGLVRNFSTTIARSFVSTGYTTQQGVQRLRHNLRHIIESMLPGGLDREGDGWRLTMRSRLAHAQARRNLAAMEDWDAETYGVPVSSAHVAYAVATFSARVLAGTDQLGVKSSSEEREGYMHLWRHTGWLLGAPAALLPATEAEALALLQVAGVCEPAPPPDSVLMAHTIINAGGLVLGIKEDDPRRRKMIEYGYRVSRALIGDELADTLLFPKKRTFGVLSLMRVIRRLSIVFGRISPRTRGEKFMVRLDAAIMDHPDFDFDLPDNRYA